MKAEWQVSRVTFDTILFGLTTVSDFGVRGGYKHYLLTVLMAILAFNFVDRVALGLLLQDIKQDLTLTDTELGFLGGITFALFYSVMGVPIARWADFGNRVRIISSTAALWSVAVVLCGVARTFVQLVLIRVVVAVGEAGCTPPAHSLIADHFDRTARPRAVSIYCLGVPLGIIVAFLWAGWLNQFFGWRMTFVLLGLPGILIAFIAYITLKEPRLYQGAGHVSVPATIGDDTVSDAKPSLKFVCATLWANRTFRSLLFYFSLQSFFAYGILTWLPAFFVRSYGMRTGEVGTWLALTYGTGGLVGSLGGGEFCLRYAARNESLQLKVMALAVCASGALSVIAYVSHQPYLSFLLIGVATAGLTIGNGPMFGTIQTLIAPRMRAVSISLVYLCANLIGMGLGPLLAGVLSDAVASWAGSDSLRYALLILAMGYFWTATYAWRASKTVDEALLASRRDDVDFLPS